MNNVKPISHSIYYHSPFWDFFFFTGLTLLIAFVGHFFVEYFNNESTAVFIYQLSWLINFPHFAATFMRVVSNPEVRKCFSKTHSSSIIFLILLTHFGYLYPDSIGKAIVAVYLLWSPFHYTGQTYGIAISYIGKSRVHFSNFEKYFLRYMIFGSYFNVMFVTNAGPGNIYFHGLAMPGLNLPVDLKFSLHPLFVASAIIFNLWYLFRYISKKPLPWLSHAVTSTLVIWYLPEGNPFLLILAVPGLHSLQYLYVTWAYYKKEGHFNPLGKVFSSNSQALKFISWYSAIVFLGFVMFWLLPFSGSFLYNLNYNASLPIIFSTVQMYHFWVDGVIWQMPKKDVLIEKNT